MRVNKTMKALLPISALLLALAAHATAAPPPATETAERLRQLAADHLARQTAGLHGDVRIRLTSPASTARLARCEAPEAFLPEGARLLGRVAVGIRCHAPATWTTYVPATISVVAPYLVAAAPLKPGQTLSPDLLESRQGDLATLAEDVLTQPEQAMGKVLATGLMAGAPLRAGMLRAPQAVAQGQGITLLVRGRGFQISSEGRALNNATEGQVVQVRTPGGQVVSGIARQGALVDIANP
jgi:flagella basal body P-ring formation protein FlgA